MLKTTIATRYDDQTNDPSIAHHWRTLALECQYLADRLRTQYNITEVNESESYANSEDMFADLERGNFRVSAINCDHPVFTTQQNISWRIAHDILGHYAVKVGFS